ncbi:MAG TPA: CdaR family protein [Candidatus Limnocylindrales bacterium]|nr:CdaR family protein [Candidatus Limnocylindrales bacterium]
MTRLIGFLRFVFRNWPLKLAAVALATLLYAGLVLSQATQEFRSPVPIEAVPQRSGVTLLTDLGSIRSIRFFAPTDLGLRIDSTTFRATVDLSKVDATGGPVTVPVVVVAVDPRIQIIDFDPARIIVRLDAVKTQSVSIRVDLGTVPPNLDTGTPVLETANAEVTGASSVVGRVTEVVAHVQLDASGIDFNRLVDLVPVDETGQIVPEVDVEPVNVRVRVPVFTDRQTKTVPVTPQIVGTPAAGFEIVSPVTVEPAVVSVEGDANDLAGLDVADTAAIQIAGASADIVKTVELQLPDGVQTIGSPTVTVTIKLRPVTGSRSFEAGLSLKGARPDLVYALSTNSVVVTIGGSIAALEAVSGATLVLGLDVTGLDVGAHAVTPTASLAGGLTLLGVSPSPVTVTITATPATPAPSPSPSPT